MTWLYRHWRKLALLLAVVVALGAIGFAGKALSGRGPGRIVEGVSCAYHGVKAWEHLRARHLGWTTYHLWAATHTCRRAAWRY